PRSPVPRRLYWRQGREGRVGESQGCGVGNKRENPRAHRQELAAVRLCWLYLLSAMRMGVHLAGHTGSGSPFDSYRGGDSIAGTSSQHCMMCPLRGSLEMFAPAWHTVSNELGLECETQWMLPPTRSRPRNKRALTC
ncbi:hypothetical protein ACHAXR_002727, partial [Thalassiosira sp. AJA248-18]